MNYNENIGNIIADARKKKNISQNTLAKRLFVTRQAVSNWENGKTRPDISVIFNLCKMLDIDIKTIVEMDDNLTIENIIEVEKKKTNRRNLIFIGVIILVFIAIIATLIIVFNRNSFVLYNVYLDSDEFSLNNSLIIKTKVRNYFQFGTLVSKISGTDENTVYNIRLYKKNGDTERLIFEQVYKENLSISENYGYGEYFDDFAADLNNLYLEISYIENNEEYVYNYKLHVEENFRSDSILYLKDKKIGASNIRNIKTNIDNTVILKNGYTYNKSLNNFEKTIDNYTIFYYPNSKVVSIRKELPEQVVLIYYFATQDRLKITLFDKINNTTSTTNYSKENYPEIYERDLTILDNEYSLLGGN